MPNDTRVRFAPSPTGFLHIGSLRTVLFNLLIAKKLGAKFILRIEDTDQARTVPGSVESLIDILNWLNIKFDEGPHVEGGECGPYIQSKRLNIYKEQLDQLLMADGAYPCFCTAKRLEEMRNAQQENKQAPRYDRKCRNLDPEEAKIRMENELFVIRQKIPLDGEVIVHDELRGEIKFACSDLDDQVLIKSNGVPTYQFANVVDDHLMKISHVVRGEEWIPSFPKNILLYQSFGWKPPKFIHMALTLNKEGGKLSKRQGDVAVEDYRAKGYLPDALINFCVLLGWHPKDDLELMNLDEMVERFEIADMRVSGSIFDIEKLDFTNGYYIRQMDDKSLAKLCEPFLPNLTKDQSGEYLEKVIALAKDRMKKLSDLPELSGYFFCDELNYDKDLLIWKKLSAFEVYTNLEQLLAYLNTINDAEWNKIELEKMIMEWIKANNKGNGDYLWPMRVALTGEKNSPGPFEVAEVLGKRTCIKRIEAAVGKLKI